MPDEKKLSVSSADELLVESGGDWAEKVRKPKLPLRLIYSAIVVLAALFVIGGCIVAFLHFFLARNCSNDSSGASWQAPCGGRRGHSPLYVNLVLDTSGVPACDIELTDASSLPCMRRRKFVTGGKETRKSYPMAMKCRDDAFEESKLGPNNCAGNPFKLVDHGTGVTIPETGVYRVQSTVTFDDSIKFYLSSVIRITPPSCAADPTCANSVHERDSASHGWLSCFNHNGPAFSPMITNKFSSCTIDGVRRFAKGDVVSLLVTQAMRSINPFHKVTHVVIHRL